MREKIKVQQIMTQAKQVEEIIKENGENLSVVNCFVVKFCTGGG